MTYGAIKISWVPFPLLPFYNFIGLLLLLSRRTLLLVSQRSGSLWPWVKTAVPFNPCPLNYIKCSILFLAQSFWKSFKMLGSSGLNMGHLKSNTISLGQIKINLVYTLQTYCNKSSKNLLIFKSNDHQVKIHCVIWVKN